MRLSRRGNKSVVATVAMAAGLMLAPGATTTASALPPCCGVDLVTTYYSNAAHTTVVGIDCSDCGDCQPIFVWGQTTSYYTTQKHYCST
jgi:hypothetical protein